VGLHAAAVDAGLGVAVGEGVEDGGLAGKGKSNDAQVQVKALRVWSHRSWFDRLTTSGTRTRSP